MWLRICSVRQCNNCTDVTSATEPSRPSRNDRYSPPLYGHNNSNYSAFWLSRYSLWPYANGRCFNVNNSHQWSHPPSDCRVHMLRQTPGWRRSRPHDHTTTPTPRLTSVPRATRARSPPVQHATGGHTPPPSRWPRAPPSYRLSDQRTYIGTGDAPSISL